jgi:hypothetical protein
VSRTSRKRACDHAVTPEKLTASKAGPRFLLLNDVAPELSTSKAQVQVMVRSGELPAIKVGDPDG